VDSNTGEFSNTTREPKNISRAEIHGHIIDWAKTQVGVREHGFNRGKEVEEYQKVVDGVSSGEAWCLCFCQAAAKHVANKLGVRNPLFPTEHCATLFRATGKAFISPNPKLGSIMIMKHKDSDSGHAGIVVDEGQIRMFETIEGNTNEEGSREGDGVYRKVRDIHGTKTMDILGFIDLPLLFLYELR
jgi:hypothetical protein